MKSLEKKRWVLLEGDGWYQDDWFHGRIISEDPVKGTVLGTVRQPSGAVVARKRFPPKYIYKIWDTVPHEMPK